MPRQRFPLPATYKHPKQQHDKQQQQRPRLAIPATHLQALAFADAVESVAKLVREVAHGCASPDEATRATTDAILAVVGDYVRCCVLALGTGQAMPPVQGLWDTQVPGMEG